MKSYNTKPFDPLSKCQYVFPDELQILHVVPTANNITCQFWKFISLLIFPLFWLTKHWLTVLVQSRNFPSFWWSWPVYLIAFCYHLTNTHSSTSFMSSSSKVVHEFLTWHVFPQMLSTYITLSVKIQHKMIYHVIMKFHLINFYFSYMFPELHPPHR